MNFYVTIIISFLKGGRDCCKCGNLERMTVHGGTTKKLTALVLLSLFAVVNNADAVTTQYVEYNGKQMAEIQILTAAEAQKTELNKLDGGEEAEQTDTYFDLPEELAGSIGDATKYWTDMIGAHSKNEQPWQLVVFGKDNYQNAGAVTDSFDADGEEAPHNYVRELLQDGKKLGTVDDFSAEENLLPKGEETSFSIITIGRPLGANRDGAIDWTTVNILDTNLDSLIKK